MPTSRKFKEITPQTGKGIEPDNTGRMGAQFEKLHNLRVHEGVWQKRPGQTKRVTGALPGTAGAAVAKDIVEYTGLTVQPSPLSETEVPTGDGTYDDWTKSSGTDGYALVDEGITTHDGNTTYLSIPAVGGGATNANTFTHTFPAFAATFVEIEKLRYRTIIKSLGDYSTAGQEIPSTGRFYPVCVLGGKSYIAIFHPETSGITELSGFLGWRWSGGYQGWWQKSDPLRYWLSGYVSNVSFDMPSDPSTGEPWTQSQIEAAEFGLMAFTWAAGLRHHYSGQRCTAVDLTVTGKEAADTRTSFKIFVSNTDWLLADQDMTGFTDIDTAAAAPITDDEDSVWDHTQFSNRTYFTNGVDDIAFFPNAPGSSWVMSKLASGTPVGRCLGSYGSRLFMGDVFHSGTRSKFRVFWSGIGVATDWTSATSGTMDLDETPGAVMKFENFTEARDQTFIGVLVVFKDDSIFHIEATGVPSDPFDKRIMTSTVGCVARRTVSRYTRTDGTSVLVFLGADNGHLNVFEWDGDQAVAIGDPISDLLKKKLGGDGYDRSWGYVDPMTHHYVLGLSQGTASPTFALVYDITKQLWSTESFEPIDAVGYWQVGGQTLAVLGRDDSYPYTGNLGVYHDESTSGTDSAINSKWRTGITRLAEEPNQRSTIYRVWIYYQNLTASTDVIVEISTDGDWPVADENTAVFTTSATDVGDHIQIEKVDFLVEGHLHQIQIRYATLDKSVIIEKVVVEYEENDTFV